MAIDAYSEGLDFAEQALCYEYTIQKLAGVTAEELVLLAVATDLESGRAKSPLLAEKISDIAVSEQQEGIGTVIRILVISK